LVIFQIITKKEIIYIIKKTEYEKTEYEKAEE
jgi:hypothetical protein